MMVKLSPMLDISKALKELSHVKEVHVVAVANECKELLVVMERGHQGESLFVCTNLLTNQPELRFTQEEERLFPGRFANGVLNYLYEPNPAVMKSGCYKLLTGRYDVFQAAYNASTDEAERAYLLGQMNEIDGYRNAGWVLTSPSEISSVYKSMGIRVGLEMKF